MQRFKNIFCVVSADLKDNSALERAVKLAENNQASLTVVVVIDEMPLNIKLDHTLWPMDFQAKKITEHLKRLDELVAPLSINVEIQTKVLTGTPFLVTIGEVLRYKCDLVIKATENDGLLERVFGSDDMHLLRKCPCPVWLVKPKSAEPYRRILAAVDVSDYYPTEELDTRHLLNIQILEMASSLALSDSAELHIVHAWEAIGESALREGAFIMRPEEEVDAYVEELRQHHKHNMNLLMSEIMNTLGRDALEYLKPQTHLPKGSPRNEVPVLAEKIKVDLVVMGTVARTGIPGFFMGNTAETILSKLDCSILAIKPKGFETPVVINE